MPQPGAFQGGIDRKSEVVYESCWDGVGSKIAQHVGRLVLCNS